MKGGSNDARLVETASRALTRIVGPAFAVRLFDAIRPVMPAAAGILGVIRPGAQDALVTHPVRLPQDVLEGWLATPRPVLAQTLAPILASADGVLSRQAEAITGPLRDELEVLRRFDAAGLGDSAGYKIMKRRVPGRGEEHTMLALIMERGARVPAGVDAALSALNPAIRAAAERCALPLVAREPILAQILEEQSLGYICISRTGAVIESNRRAWEIASRYREAAGIVGRARLTADMAARARERARAGRPWILPGRSPAALLEVSVHRLAKEVHALPDDVLLVVLKEVYAPPAAPIASALRDLTPRQREIALLLARTGLPNKVIAARLGLSEATVRKHAENVYRALGVHSRAELSMLMR